MIYNTDMNMFNYFNGTIWIVLASIFFGTTDEIDAATLPAGSLYYDTYIEEMGWSDGITTNPIPMQVNFWKTTGNAGTDPATNFIGTTDANNFIIKANSIEGFMMDTFGQIGLNGIARGVPLTINVENASDALYFYDTDNGGIFAEVGSYAQPFRINDLSSNGFAAFGLLGFKIFKNATEYNLDFPDTTGTLATLENLVQGTYADDAAADADTDLPSGALYKLTGSRAIYQKP
jgi:hypothetical protein